MTPTPHTIDDFPELQPGDVLLDCSRSLIGWAIRFRTWSDVEHVEVYLGEGRSVASRNGIGVGKYPLRIDGLVRVFRPVENPDVIAGLLWFADVDGLPYAWTDLLRFYGWALDSAKGMICSQFADAFLRQCGVQLFNVQYPDGAVTPRDFEITPGLQEIWRAK